jgi:hypothetical protein
MSSGLPLKADIAQYRRHVSNVPEGEMPLFDHLVGANEQERRNCEAERFGCVQVYKELNLGDLLNRQVCRLVAHSYPAGIDASLPG